MRIIHQEERTWRRSQKENQKDLHQANQAIPTYKRNATQRQWWIRFDVAWRSGDEVLPNDVYEKIKTKHWRKCGTVQADILKKTRPEHMHFLDGICF